MEICIESEVDISDLFSPFFYLLLLVGVLQIPFEPAARRGTVFYHVSTDWKSSLSKEDLQDERVLELYRKYESVHVDPVVLEFDEESFFNDKESCS